MDGRITFNPNGTVNMTGRQQVRGVLTSRDLYGEECATCDGSGTLPLMNVLGVKVKDVTCPGCNGQGYTED